MLTRRLQGNSTANTPTNKAPHLNGAGTRKCISWIDRFVESTVNLESPVLFRRWSAIATIAAALEQKVWLQTSTPLFPNIYTVIIGHPGVGKTRSVRAAKRYFTELPEHHLAPTSMSPASLVDALTRSKRTHIDKLGVAKEYNSITIMADELGAFMHKYDDEMVGVLSAFYDNDIYGQERRGNELRIKIKSPQVTMLAGSTPSNLMKFMPENAWEQGFTSRIVLVFSDERFVGDDFAVEDKGIDPDLVADLKVINGLHGKFEVTEAYRSAVNDWRAAGEPVVPNHPKLIHYATRRRVHLYKLSMVAAIDRSNHLLLTKDDFNRALGWLLEAELTMPDIFKAGAGSADSKAMDEIFHFVLVNEAKYKNGKGVSLGVPEHKMINFARERLPVHSILRVVEIMEQAGKIRSLGMDGRTGQRRFVAEVPDITDVDL